MALRRSCSQSGPTEAITRRLGIGASFWAVLLLGCGEEARISATAVLPSPLALDMLTVTVQDRGRTIEWTGDDFQASPSATPTTTEVETSTSGPALEVAFRLESDGVVLASGSATLPRKSDWSWNVTVDAATDDPRLSCFGCVGSQAFPLAESFRAPGRDSVWLVWGGNSISDPAIY